MADSQSPRYGCTYMTAFTSASAKTSSLYVNVSAPTFDAILHNVYLQSLQARKQLTIMEVLRHNATTFLTLNDDDRQAMYYQYTHGHSRHLALQQDRFVINLNPQARALVTEAGKSLAEISGASLTIAETITSLLLFTPAILY